MLLQFVMQGTAPVRGCKIELDLKSDKKFGFVMSHETRKPLHMDAETEKIRDREFPLRDCVGIVSSRYHHHH